MIVRPEITVDTIDIIALTTVPILTAASYVTLIKNLRKVAPDKPSQEVVRADKRILALLTEAQRTLVARLGDEADARLERSFDGLVDRLWLFQRMFFEYWSLYEHEGIGLLSKEDRAEIELEECQELSDVAADLNARMYGDGTQFLRTNYPEQATFMASRLELVEDKGLADTYEELVGPRAAKLIMVCQRRYEAMVADRASRKSGPIGDLRSLRLRMYRGIQLYSMAVAGMLDEEDPESAHVVYRALLPNLLARSPQRSSGGGNGGPASEAEAGTEAAEPTPAEDAGGESFEQFDEVEDFDDQDQPGGE